MMKFLSDLKRSKSWIQKRNVGTVFTLSQQLRKMSPNSPNIGLACSRIQNTGPMEPICAAIISTVGITKNKIRLGEIMDCICNKWARVEPPMFSKHHQNCQLFIKPDIKIFQLNECDWWADYSLEKAIENYLHETGVPYVDGIENPHELSDHEMKTLIHSGEDGIGPKMSFIDRLIMDIEKGATFPCLFASTEY
jgi:hypothetical protein